MEYPPISCRSVGGQIAKPLYFSFVEFFSRKNSEERSSSKPNLSYLIMNQLILDILSLEDWIPPVRQAKSKV